MLALETRDLTKRYRAVLAVDSLNLKVPAGSVFGFLGPNGAGKTTTIRMLMGLARPTSGEARLLGQPAGPESPVRARVGFLPDVPAFYGWMSAGEYLEFAGRLFGLERAALGRRIGELLEFTGLSGVKTRIGGFSRGMRQRLGLAQALINDPELVVLDEPTSALDPIGRHGVLEAIRALAAGAGTGRAGGGGAGRATTVFFSTHILADVERVCDRVAVIDRGRLVADDTLKALKSRYSRPLFNVTLASGAAELSRALRGLEWVEKVETQEGPESLVRVLARDGDAAKVALPRVIGEKGLALLRFEVSEPTLEDIFLRLVNEK